MKRLGNGSIAQASSGILAAVLTSDWRRGVLQAPSLRAFHGQVAGSKNRGSSESPGREGRQRAAQAFLRSAARIVRRVSTGRVVRRTAGDRSVGSRYPVRRQQPAQGFCAGCRGHEMPGKFIDLLKTESPAQGRRLMRANAMNCKAAAGNSKRAEDCPHALCLRSLQNPQATSPARERKQGFAGGEGCACGNFTKVSSASRHACPAKDPIFLPHSSSRRSAVAGAGGAEPVSVARPRFEPGQGCRPRNTPHPPKFVSVLCVPTRSCCLLSVSSFCFAFSFGP